VGQKPQNPMGSKNSLGCNGSGSILGTAGCGPACPVVWEGGGASAPPPTRLVRFWICLPGNAESQLGFLSCLGGVLLWIVARAKNASGRNKLRPYEKIRRQVLVLLM
jgi:hypothetical protein